MLDGVQDALEKRIDNLNLLVVEVFTWKRSVVNLVLALGAGAVGREPLVDALDMVAVETRQRLEVDTIIVINKANGAARKSLLNRQIGSRLLVGERWKKMASSRGARAIAVESLPHDLSEELSEILAFEDVVEMLMERMSDVLVAVVVVIVIVREVVRVFVVRVSIRGRIIAVISA